jgi:methionyl-tRNA formyltransferase
MRVVFMGTPAFAVPSLEAVAAAHDVALVLTAPDRPSGRGRDPRPSSVKLAALRLGLSLAQPATLRDAAAAEAVRLAQPDVIVVAAYGLILPPDMLSIPPLGCVNVHASLLPRWRGAAPVQRAILAGDERTGVSIMSMEAGLDTGPVAERVETHVDALDAAGLTAMLADLGAQALVRTLDAMASGSAIWEAQDQSLVTYAEKMTAADVALAPDVTVEEAVRRVRASTSSAPSRAVIEGTAVTVVSARRAEDPTLPNRPGAIHADSGMLALGAVDGWLEVLRLVPAGRKEMDGAAFARGARLPEGPSWSAPS